MQILKQSPNEDCITALAWLQTAPNESKKERETNRKKKETNQAERAARMEQDFCDNTRQVALANNGIEK